MPIYRFKNKYGQAFEEYRLLRDYTEKTLRFTPEHGYQVFDLDINAAPAAHDWGMGKTFENVGHKPQTFYDKASYRRYLKQHGLREYDAEGWV